MKAKCLAFVIVVCATWKTLAAYDCKADGSYYALNVQFNKVIVDGSSIPQFSCSLLHSSSSSQVRTVTFVNSSLKEVPKSLFDKFNQITSANLSHSGIKEINRYSLDRTSSLLILDLSRNELSVLKAFSFAGANALTLLNLAHNNISVIEDTAFNTLSSLTVLQLSGNKLRTLESNLFNPLVALKTIYLNSNELEVVEQSLFSSNSVLENVLLQHNRISVVDEGAFNVAALPALKILSLSNNNLTMLDLTGVRVNQLFLGNNKLQEITISPSIYSINADNNRLTSVSLPENSSGLLLNTLTVVNNSITTLETIGKLHSVVNLDLANNPIGPLNLTSFANLVKLEELGLERTGISNLQHGTFAQQVALKVLDISYNNLDRFDFDILTSSAHLQKIYVDGNRLKSIEFEHLKKTLPSLVEIGLSDNNWNCSYLIKLVRYCTENAIQLYRKPEVLVQNETNVKGIYCYDEKNPLANWNATLQRFAAHPHLNDTSEDGALQAMLQSVLDDVRRFSEAHADVPNQTSKLDGAVYDLTRNQFTLQKDLNSLRQSLFEVRLQLLANRTNGSAQGVDSDELRRMIETANNLTLDKQELSAKTLDFKLYEQSFKVEKALELGKENGDKLTVLAKRVEQWIANGVGSGGLVGQDRLHQQGGSSGHNDALIVTVLVMVCLTLALVVFALFKPLRRPLTIERNRYNNRDSSLTTIVDNAI